MLYPSNSGHHTKHLVALTLLLVGVTSWLILRTDSVHWSAPTDITDTAPRSKLAGRNDAVSTSAATDAAARAWVYEAYDKLPLYFEANQGQADSQVDFLARGNGYSVFLTARGALLSLQKSQGVKARVSDARSSGPTQPTLSNSDTALLGIQVVGANPQPQVSGLEQLPGKINYYIGNDSDKWMENISTYARVEYQDVYPGIDLVYYGNQRHLEYDFVVAPGADPNAIRLVYWGAEKLEVDAYGNLLLILGDKQIRQVKPLIYQEVNGVRQEVTGGYVLDGQQVSFELGTYATSKPLVIDPTLTYSTFFGGDGEGPSYGMAVDAAGVRKMCVQLLGVSGTTIKPTPLLTTSEGTYILGGVTDTWGKPWTSANLSNGSFQVRIINVSSDPNRDFSLDWVGVKVHYR